ncbi:hypothetical protein PVK06_035441 [Gossypium arboreum]|uniref:Zinc knuckle CX2CX4HX4C domain-containing protein n=1 Tax=Gossypium arboreum TaxID=29729 RepID=A0ABR0NIX2_GOSAR|nr:hypothetical protein PVK06_035441 [Gossypium arboreum]
MTVYINLDKPLISQVLINRILQRIEYEYLPIVCFSCRCYGHVKEICPTKEISPESVAGDKPNGVREQAVAMVTAGNGMLNETKAYCLWKLVKRRSRRNFRDTRKNNTKNHRGLVVKSRFDALENLNGKEKFKRKDVEDIVVVVLWNRDLKRGKNFRGEKASIPSLKNNGHFHYLGQELNVVIREPKGKAKVV